MPESAQERVDKTALLKGILNAYPQTSILREYLQNSDDSKATSQIFILDERLHPTTSLVETLLEDRQGPALVAINDGTLTNEDWDAIRTIHSSSKLTDGSATGKNGLGFRASYHLTENPHIFSGQRLLILDPHHKFTQNPGGVFLDVLRERDEYEDQFAPFAAVTTQSISPFNGTIFRLPLRTSKQALKSKIKRTSTSVHDIFSLLSAFCKNELEEVVLFLKHIRTIEVKHIKPNGKVVTMGRVSVERKKGKCYVEHSVNGGRTSKRLWYIHHLQAKDDEASHILSKRLGYGIRDQLHVEKLSSAVSLAFPTTGPKVKGRLFTLLPLPIMTHFPVHLNADFALTPDRQSLKNILEAGDTQSRDSLLVEWNKFIFDTLAPQAWAQLLEDVTGASEYSHLGTSYALWPTEPNDSGSYWSKITTQTVQEILLKDFSVFPTAIANEDDSFYFMSLGDPSVMLSSPSPSVNLELLAELGINVVKPSAYIFKILQKLQDSFSSHIISPEVVYNFIKAKYSTRRSLECTRDLLPLVDYVVSIKSSSPTISFIRHVPWFTVQVGSFIHHVSLGSPKKRYIVPSSEDESSLFGSYCHSMLSWKCMSDDLRAKVLLPQHHRDLNVSLFEPSHLVPILKENFGRDGTGKPVKFKPDAHSWLVNFWVWISDWPYRDEFLKLENALSDLRIIPLAKGTREVFRHGAVDFHVGVEAVAVEAWAKLGVYPIDEGLADVSRNLKAVISVPRSPSYVPHLITNCECDKQGELSEDQLVALQDSLCAGFPAKKKLVLSQTEHDRLLKMKVFFISLGGEDSWKLGSIDDDNAIYTRVSSSFPLPALDGHVFVDMQDSNTAKLVSLFKGKCDSFTEEDLLKLAFKHWDQQDEDCKKRIIDWAFRNANKSILKVLCTLKDLPFVTVKGSDDRVAPSAELISPTSPLNSLYKGEEGKILSGDFADDFLPIMHQLGFVHETLDEYVIAERLDYLSSAVDDPKRTQKAKLFIQLCNISWKPEYSSLISSEIRKTSWMPLKGGAFGSPNECRDAVSRGTDGEHPFLYDLALKELAKDIQIASPDFRAALGWSANVDLRTLMEQFRATVNLPPQNKTRHNRLVVLLECLGLLFEEEKIHQAFLDHFWKTFCDSPWVPVSKASVPIKAKHALLSDDIDLKPPFRRIVDFEHTGFLQAVGCSLRPQYNVLCEELSTLNFSTQKEIQAGILILHEIAECHMDDNHFDPESILVPTDGGGCDRLNMVFYQDTDSPTVLKNTPNDLKAVHRSISRQLAEDLHIPPLTSLVLDKDETCVWIDDADDDDEPQMSEDLVTRIQGFLREYDVRYALNEFLANADDAVAESVCVSLDFPTKKGNRLLSDKFEEFGNSSVFILANDAQLSPDDVLGLLKVGTGGKADRSETHGRHGLGALSLYYFTDVATIISGNTVLFLDPSGDYLPRNRSHKQRTALQMPLDQVLNLYPDQLRPYDKRYKFSSKKPYDGTLFILPLRSKISPVEYDHSDVHELLKGMYLELAQNSFFFTNLKAINAYERTGSVEKALWSLSATRSPEESFKEQHRHQKRRTVTISCKMGSSKKTSTEEWLVTSMKNIKIPSFHDETAAALKLNQSQMVVQLAVPLEKHEKKHSFLFSTLRLPKATSMPYHINARFFLSSNRQTIVLDPSGSDDQRDPKTAYNLWILRELVPVLYLSTYAYLFNLGRAEDVKDSFFNNRCWWLVDAEDDISKIVRQAFYDKLPDSKHLILSDVNSTLLPFNRAVLSSKEPAIITKLLTQIRTPGFIVNNWSHDLAELASATVVDSRFVKSSLVNVNIKSIRDLYTAGHLESEDFPSILKYVHTEPNLAGMCCLLLSTNSVILIPTSSQAPVYHTSITSLPRIFPCAQFLSDQYHEIEAERLVCDHDINVLGLNKDRLLALVQLQLSHLEVGEERDMWLKKFWKLYPTLPDSGFPSVADLEESQLPIIPSAQSYLSITDCTPSNVVYHSSNRKKPRWFLGALAKLGVDYIDLTDNSTIEKHIHNRFPDALVNLLLCLSLGNKGVASWHKLTSNEVTKMSSWIQKLLSDFLEIDDPNPVALRVLAKLPIWEAQFNDKIIRLSPSDVRFLPQDRLSLSIIKPYQRRGVAIAPWSHELETLTAILGNGNRVLDAHTVFGTVRLPQNIPPGDKKQISSLRSFIASMLDFPISDIRNIGLKVPDRSGVLWNINHFYDETVHLFQNTLQQVEQPPFMHLDFHHLRLKLRHLGLKYDITIDTFRHCALAVSHAAIRVEGAPTRSDVYRMADAAFDVYQDDVPNLVMVNTGIWQEIDSEYGFIQPAELVREGIPGDLEAYFEKTDEEILSILSCPSDLVLREYHPVVWTQRLPFFHEPTSQNLLRLNRTLGIPTASEVVAHLRVLATRVAIDHPQNMAVLSDLKATYRWLDDHSKESREHLVEHFDVKLFLNVNDPEKESWTDQWVSARQLVPGLRYDHGVLRSVRAFMKHYNQLLECAGCEPFQLDSKSLNNRGDESESRHTVSRKIFDEMRLTGEDTDIVLVPTRHPEPDVEEGDSDLADDDTDGQDNSNDRDKLFFESMDKIADNHLCAHRVFLASMFTYVRNAGNGWKQSGEMPFYGSAFGAKAFLDFAYTGDFQPLVMPSTRRGYTRLMGELLQLLTIADEWGLQDFKNLLEDKFISEYRIIEQLANKHQTMLNEAERYGADKMKTALLAYRQRNEFAMRRI